MTENKYFDEVTDTDAFDGKLWRKCHERMIAISKAICKAWPQIEEVRVINHLKLFNPEYVEAKKKMEQMLSAQLNNATLPDRVKKP